MLDDEFTGRDSRTALRRGAVLSRRAISSFSTERMKLGGAEVREKMVYHDGRDWAIEKYDGDYWCLPLDTDEWQKGLPPGMTVDDLNMLFAGELEPVPTDPTLSR